ncbi:putative CAP domain-containing protein [Rosa chinensis]|uniref:Putative CAP domain-containing protein n=2 Tax=Rosa chinensis TaxID=74649 RepID=A0A2P6PJU3_ROSCH|nr:putative CAP domain-containing protein [Rosa chinensis]
MPLVQLLFSYAAKMGFNKQNLITVCSAALILITYVPLASTVEDDSGFLKAHNEIRKEHGLPPLQWNKTLAEYAQNYANKRSGDCAMEHSDAPYSENIASGLGMTGEAATKYWCTEKAEYDYNTNKCTGPEEDGCRHYTIIVTRITTQLGCARAKCKNGDMFVSCNYDPSGEPDERPY